jgi:hypothetical protein
MVRKFSLILMIMMGFACAAQTVKVSKDKTRIKGDQAEGFAVELEGNENDVTSALNRYLKSFAKVKGANPMSTTEVVIGGTSYANPIYASVRSKSDGAVAWMGLKESEWPEDDHKKIMKELERMTYEFGVKYYRDKIQVQIDESTRALQAVEKQQQRLVTENKNLNSRLENNAKEKIQLEKSLEVNKLENLTLLTKIEQNKVSQDSVSIVAEQVRKVVEMHKERQKKVN